MVEARGDRSEIRQLASAETPDGLVPHPAPRLRLADSRHRSFRPGQVSRERRS